jgi:serine/tyrosine/threonine adenylyltransferase
MQWNFDNSYLKLPPVFYHRQPAVPVAKPRLVIFNHRLSQTLGLGEYSELSDLPILSGNALAPGSEPLAQAYRGHQFGHFADLGDGRALLLGEHLAPDGKRWDIQLKGSGRTVYSRRGDGRAALGPMLREYLISEAMHALGIASTRSLAVVSTGEPVFRQTALEGAILTRVAASHIRVGTFEYAATIKNTPALQSLADYTLQRHYPEHFGTPDAYLKLLESVVQRQAKLVAQWLLVGFIHGVMNTDNMAISGETIDYGPCAFMDGYDTETVFSSIDQHGRYRYSNQPSIAQWNLERFAETLLPLLGEDVDKAREKAIQALERFGDVFREYWLQGMRSKLGLSSENDSHLSLIGELLNLMSAQKADYTRTFRDLSFASLPAHPFYQTGAFVDWHRKWQSELQQQTQSTPVIFEQMQKVNPAIIARNSFVEDALQSATHGDMAKFEALLHAVSSPFHPAKESKVFENPPAQVDPDYRTFCGT